MELGLSNTLLAGDPRLVDHIVGEVKSQGIFDQFRKECIADVDTKPAYQNLRTRVEGSVNSFLSKQPWKPDLNKNQLRENLRKHIHEASYLDAGVERIVDQVVNPKVYSVFMSQIEDVVYKFLGIERPKSRERNGACGLKDLLPKDLDPVSPESDKNSLKDVSLESVDAIDDLDIKEDEKSCNEQKFQDGDILNEKSKDVASENGHVSPEEKTLDETGKTSNKTGSNLNLNTSGKSDDKVDEDEEDSPTFEPIDIMNLNESNISNDSHLSGISELTSHRSRSPDFCNELSRDNFDYSNQDSQLSKVSSDSRLSIVTDFGSSNHASTPLHDSLKDEVNRDKCDVKSTKDSFKAVREFESCKNKNSRSIFEFNKGKDLQEVKDSKSVKNNLSSKENSRDAMDGAAKDKYEHKNNKDKNRDSDSSKSKSRDKNNLKDSKYHRDKSSDKKKQKSHTSVKYDKYDKNKSKDKSDQLRENSDKLKDTEYPKDNSNKLKEEKKDNGNKEVKDLKDIYKEKIRELREKKELTEKEKLNKDNRDVKSNKENKDKKDSPKDKKPYKKDHKSSSSKNSSLNTHEVKTSEKIVDGKEKRSESKDKGKRDEKRISKDSKSKNTFNSKTDVTEKSDKQDLKKSSKCEKEEKLDVKKDVKSSNDKAANKKDVKGHSQSKGSSRTEKIDSRRDSKTDSQSKDKKRRDDKKSKPKDDHSSLRKNSNDRRSTDRDGSNGSSSKSSQSSNSSSNTAINKSSSTNLSKSSGHVSNSSSETSDSIEEAQSTDLKLMSEQQNYKVDKANTDFYKTNNSFEADVSSNSEVYTKHGESDSGEVNLPLKKRPLLNEESNIGMGEIKVKKPKFAKNIHEAKKLMKIRKQMEKQKLRESKKIERKVQQKVEQTVPTSTPNNVDNVESVPDEERVQIIEIPDEEYEEPYPDTHQHTNLTLDERSIIMLESEACTKDLLQVHSSLNLKLSDMELCIKKSLSEAIPNNKVENTITQNCNSNVGPNSPDSKNVQNSKDSESQSTEDSNVAVLKEAEVTSEKSEGVLQETSAAKINEITVLVKPESTSKEKTLEQPQSTSNDDVDDESDTKDAHVHMPSTSVEDPQKDSHTSTEVTTVTSKNDYMAVESTSTSAEENEDCRYFKVDNEKSEKFSNFLESLELVENSSLEDIIESLGGQVVSSIPKAMAPPLPKRKHSSSPLTDILLNNTNNNNDGHKKALNVPSENALNNIKKRKLVASKKQRLHANLCAPQGLLNGENFVMPLSPESDVSATSEKIPSSNLIKEEKSRHRSSQRYSSDDLYKPRPLFSSSSRRSRRSNQA